MKSNMNKEIIAGIFLLTGIIVIVISIFVLGAKTGFGEAKYYINVIFSDVGGLRVGAPVRLAGVDVGTVIDIEFIRTPIAGNKQVRVSLGILNKFNKDVQRCSVYTIKTEGLLGDKLIDIELPKPEEVCQVPKVGEYIIGHEPLDIKNLADDFSETAKYFTYLTQRMTDLVDDLQGFAKTSKRLMDRVEDRLIEGTLFSVFGPSKQQ